MSFLIEFPDYPAAEMPAIPDGWKDISWHNDACPSFDAYGYHVFVDYADPAKREFPDTMRFVVMDEDEESGEQVCRVESDDWAHVVAFITSEARDAGRINAG